MRESPPTPEPVTPPAESRFTVDLKANTFACEVAIWRTDAKGDPVRDARGEPIVDRPIGRFVFRVPTLLDEAKLGVRRAQLLEGQQQVDMRTFFLMEAFATLPQVTVTAPDGWDWTTLALEEEAALGAIYRDYAEGRDQFRAARHGGGAGARV